MILDRCGLEKIRQTIVVTGTALSGLDTSPKTRSPLTMTCHVVVTPQSGTYKLISVQCAHGTTVIKAVAH